MSRVRIATLQPRVPALTVTQRGTSTPSTASRAVYESRRWREHVRPAKLCRDPLCQRCTLLGMVVAALHVDHWKRISEGGNAWADSNLVSLCATHHAEKSTAERAGQPLFEIAPSAAPLVSWLT